MSKKIETNQNYSNNTNEIITMISKNQLTNHLMKLKIISKNQ